MLWIDRLVRLYGGVPLAVAIGVEHQRGPALRLRGVPGLVEHLGIEPADDRTAAARPLFVVLVEAELQMVRVKAGIDESILHRRRVEHRELPMALLQRQELCRGMVGALLGSPRERLIQINVSRGIPANV